MAEQLAGRGLASVLHALDCGLRDLSSMAGDAVWQARLRLAVLCSLQQQAVQQAQALLARCDVCVGTAAPKRSSSSHLQRPAAAEAKRPRLPPTADLQASSPSATIDATC